MHGGCRLDHRATATSSTARWPTAPPVFMYEGAPNWPEPDRLWQLIDEYRVNILYTAPTAIRAFIKWGDDWPRKHDLSSLRLLGSVGEPINPEAWMWYHEKIGGERCPIVGYLVADRDRRDHDHPDAGRDADQARLGHAAVLRRGCGGGGRPRQRSRRRTWAASWSSASRGPPCSARSTATSRAIKKRTGARSRALTSPATARAATRTAISGSWAGSTTC